jgi:hypothetical protein
MRTLRILVLSCSVICIGLAPGARAANITVGSPLIGSFTQGSIGPATTLFNAKGPANLVSPVNGVVVGWNVIGAEGGPFYLRILTPDGLAEFAGAGKSGPATPLTTGVQHFEALMPIKAGQLVAIDNTNGADTIGVIASPAAEYEFFAAGTLAEGASAAPTLRPGLELDFNAEVQPAPVVLGLGTTAGPVAGGTDVLISGTDLEGATSVKFGGVAAAFGHVSETAVLATSPPGASAGGVPISVTTLAGTGTSSQLFTYQAAAPPTPIVVQPTPTVAECVVPNLIGKRLKAARKRIRAAGCKVGNVLKLGGVTAKTGTVVKQNPKPGKHRAVGSKVNFKLGGQAGERVG